MWKQVICYIFNLSLYQRGQAVGSENEQEGLSTAPAFFWSSSWPPNYNVTPTSFTPNLSVVSCLALSRRLFWAQFAERSHKEKACFPFWVSLESVGPLSVASTQTAVMEQMPLNGSPVKTSGLRQSRLSFSCSFPRALQPHDLFPIICQWQTSGRLRQAAGGPKRWSTISVASWPAELRKSTRAFSQNQAAADLIWQSKVS